MKIAFSRTHQNAYRVWSHRPSGGKSSMGTVAKLAGENVWSYKRWIEEEDGSIVAVIFKGATRRDAVNAAYDGEDET